MYYDVSGGTGARHNAFIIQGAMIPGPPEIALYGLLTGRIAPRSGKIRGIWANIQ
jgi:hypothetical protein